MTAILIDTNDPNAISFSDTDDSEYYSSDDELTIEESEWERKNRNTISLPYYMKSQLPSRRDLYHICFKEVERSNSNKLYIISQNIIRQQKLEEDIKAKHDYLNKKKEELDSNISNKENQQSQFDLEEDNKYKEDCLRKSKQLCNAIREGRECKHREHCLYSHDISLFKKSMNKSNTKKEPCSYFQKFGKCNYGDKCRFSHDVKVEEKKPCQHFIKFGKCDYGDKCRFSHDVKVEAKKPCPHFKKYGKCNFGAKCKISH